MTARVLGSAALVLCAAVIFLYIPVMQGGVVWDDHDILYRYDLFTMEHWFHNSFGRPFLDEQYYRPLPLVTLILNGIGGATNYPVIAHATNVAIFCVNIVLVMLLTWYASAGQKTAVIVAGVFYAFHPALIEPVSWISGRCDLLLTMFVLLAFCADAVIIKNVFIKMTMLSLCFLAAALSKEMAVVFPLILLCWRVVLERREFDTRRDLRVWLCTASNLTYMKWLLLTGVFYLLIRYGMLGYLIKNTPAQVGPGPADTLPSHIFLVLKTYAWYWLLQLFPHYDLSVVYPTNYPVPSNDPGVVIGFLLLVISLTAIFFLKISTRIKCGIFVVMVLFLPIANIKKLELWDNFIHTRFLTLPIACLAIFFSAPLVDAITKCRLRLRILFCCAGLVWLFGSLVNLRVTVPLWSHELLLWKWAVDAKPQSNIVWRNYTSSLMRAKNYRECIDVIDRAKTYKKDDHHLYINAAYCYNAIGDKDKARIYVRALLKQSDMAPADYSSVLTMGARLNMDRLLAAGKRAGNITADEYNNIVVILERAMAMNKGNDDARYALMAWYIFNNKNDLAPQLVSGLRAQKPEIRQMRIKLIRQHIAAMNMLSADNTVILNTILNDLE